MYVDLLSDERSFSANRAICEFLNLNGRSIFPDADEILSNEDSSDKIGYGLSRVLSGRLSKGKFYGSDYYLSEISESVAKRILAKITDAQRELSGRVAKAFIFSW